MYDGIFIFLSRLCFKDYRKSFLFIYSIREKKKFRNISDDAWAGHANISCTVHVEKYILSYNGCGLWCTILCLSAFNDKSIVTYVHVFLFHFLQLDVRME